jgi:hypothetical protein
LSAGLIAVAAIMPEAMRSGKPHWDAAITQALWI